MMKSQPLQNCFGISDERFEFVVALFGTREFEHLDFLKLMLPFDAARVFSRSARLGPKAGRPGADFDWQVLRVQRFIAVQTGEFHFGRRRQPEVCSFKVEHIRGKFRELPDAGE